MVGCVQYYKDAMLNRFYAICNCCACCCGAMHAWDNGTPIQGESLEIEKLIASAAES